MDTRIIIGHTTTDSVKIWTRGDKKNKGGTLSVLLDGGTVWSAATDHNDGNGYCETVQVDGLKENTSYDVTFSLGKKAYQGSFKTFPQDSDVLSFMFSSCLLRVPIIGFKGRIFSRLKEIREANDCRFMLHCGDQIYIDTKNPISKPTYKKYQNKYEGAWSMRGAREFFANGSNYMMLDDHEIANDFDLARPELLEHKNIGLQVYEDFQHAHNPTTPWGQYYYSFQCAKVHFFVVDVRMERNSVEERMISDAQESALMRWMDRHKDELKIVVTPVPFIIQAREGKWIHRSDQWGGRAYHKQRTRIMNHIMDKGHERLFFVTGDMHSAVVGKQTITTDAKKKVEHVEFMAGPLHQAMVNGPFAFEESREMIDEWPRRGDHYRYDRLKMNEYEFNAAVVKIERSGDKYNIKVSWHAVQKDNKPVLLEHSLTL